ncbi:nucleotidyltransferase family protein [Halovenus marina]|uniref:nucleotidyltransferase family protein n=1 Tax=Halovenus marina TaxID=3396621 RepID=UPI003F57235B
MKAIILAAGEGTRLRPRTETKPKPMVEVAGKPILEHCFETVLDCGITEAVVVVGYEKGQIIDRYGDSHRSLALTYAEQPERKGLAHAVSMAEPYVDADCLILNGDNIYRGNLSEVLSRHRETDADITFPVEEVSPERAKQGAVCELDAHGNVVGLVEKPETPPSTLVPAAAYVVPPEIFPSCEIVRPSERGEYELPDAIDTLINSGYTVETVPFRGWKANINTETDLERVHERLSERDR